MHRRHSHLMERPPEYHVYVMALGIFGQADQDNQKKIPDLTSGISIKNNFYQLWLIVYASDFSDLLLFGEFFKVKISF